MRRTWNQADKERDCKLLMLRHEALEKKEEELVAKIAEVVDNRKSAERKDDPFAAGNNIVAYINANGTTSNGVEATPAVKGDDTTSAAKNGRRPRMRNKR